MSKSTYVEFRNEGFWAYDVSAAVLLKFLVDEARAWSTHTDRAWLDLAIADWKVYVAVSDYGLPLPSDWTEAQIKVICQLLAAASKKLLTASAISDHEAQSWDVVDGGIDLRGERRLATKPVAELGNAIAELLAGDLAVPPQGFAWSFGTSQGRSLVRARPSQGQ